MNTEQRQIYIIRGYQNSTVIKKKKSKLSQVTTETLLIGDGKAVGTRYGDHSNLFARWSNATVCDIVDRSLSSEEASTYIRNFLNSNPPRLFPFSQDRVIFFVSLFPPCKLVFHRWWQSMNTFRQEYLFKPWWIRTKGLLFHLWPDGVFQANR